MPRRESSGWAPFYRLIFDSPIWRGQSATTKVVLVWIIGRVRHTAWQDTPAGSVDVTIDQISIECDTSRNTTRSAIDVLQAEGFIVASRSRSGLRISVVDFERWLASSNESTERSKQRPVAVDTNGMPDRSDAQNLTGKCSMVDPPSLEEEEKDLVATQQVLFDPPTSRSRSGVKAPAGYKECIEHFHSLYKQSYGSSPTWTAAQGSQLKRLLNDHAADEVKRRTTILFSSPPKWMQPPYTFGTLVRHFDALVTEARPAQSTTGRRGGMTAADILRHARGQQ